MKNTIIGLALMCLASTLFGQVPDCTGQQPLVSPDNNFIRIHGTAVIPTNGVFQCVTSTQDAAGFNWLGLGGSVMAGSFSPTIFNIYSSADKFLNPDPAQDGIVWGGVSSLFSQFSVPSYFISTRSKPGGPHDYLIFEYRGNQGTVVVVNIVVEPVP